MMQHAGNPAPYAEPRHPITNAEDTRGHVAARRE